MITAINGNNYSNVRHFGLIQQNKSNSIRYSNKMMADSVSFTGGTKTMVKLSERTSEMVQKFAQQLKVNKMYKIDSPIEHIQMASVASKTNPNARHLYIQYSGYSKDNTVKYITFSINNTGEVYENSTTKIKSTKDIQLYESILPKLINKASKEFRISLK